MKQVCITHPDPFIRSSLMFQLRKMKPCTFISLSLNKLLLLLLLSECDYNLLLQWLFDSNNRLCFKTVPNPITPCTHVIRLCRNNFYHSYGFKNTSQCQLWIQVCCYVFYPLKGFTSTCYFIIVVDNKKIYNYILCRACVCGHFNMHFVLDTCLSLMQCVILVLTPGVQIWILHRM